MITLSLGLLICLVSFSQNTIFYSGFEGPTFDEGWTTGMSTSIEESPSDYPSGLDPWEEWNLFDTPEYVHSGQFGAFIGGTLNLEDKYDWLMTPEINVPVNAVTNVNYWMWYHSSNFITYFYIMVYDIDAGTWELAYSLSDENTYLHYVEEYSFDLGPWEGKNIQVAFVKRGTYQFAMDDISCISIDNGNDLALNAIITPGNENGCTLSDDEEVKVIVENLGTANINSFDLLYTINNDIFITETVNEEINVGETLEYTFVERADLSVLGEYTINVQVTVEDDQNTQNNQLTTNVISANAVISIELLTDQWSPSDNNWELIDSENNIVASAQIGDLPKEELTITDVCVFLDECYTFSIYDSFGDGISGDGGAPGYLNVYYNDELVGGFKTNEADFGNEFIIEEIGEGCSVNINEISSPELNAYPNPVNNTLYVENLYDVKSLTIIDILGREYPQHVNNATNKIDFSNFGTGMYIVRVISNNNKENNLLIQKR